MLTLLTLLKVFGFFILIFRWRHNLIHLNDQSVFDLMLRIKKTLKAEKENANESEIILVQYSVDVYDQKCFLILQHLPRNVSFAELFEFMHKISCFKLFYWSIKLHCMVAYFSLLDVCICLYNNLLACAKEQTSFILCINIVRSSLQIK